MHKKILAIGMILLLILINGCGGQGHIGAMYA